MAAEAARELGVLVIAFYPLELRHATHMATQTITWVGLGFVLLIAGIAMERRRTQ